jgi:hypothetical protein
MYEPEELLISRSYIDDWCAPYLHLEFLNSAQLTVHSLGNSPYNGSTFFGRARPNIKVVSKGTEEVWTQKEVGRPTTSQKIKSSLVMREVLYEGSSVAGRGTLGVQVADRRISLPRH